MADSSNNIVNLRDLSAELLEKAATVKHGRATHSFRAVPGGCRCRWLAITWRNW